jgi:hypothetical protein
LLAFSVGRLPADAREIIAGHLDGCPHCLAALQSLDDRSDYLIADLRQPLPPELFSAATCRRVLALVGQGRGGPGGPAGAGPAPPPVPEQWGDYRILEKLGQGGMGAVYKAVHTRLGKTVAVKVLSPARAGNPKAAERFRREMRVLGGLDHPNLVRALDAREEGGVPLLIMEHLEGSDLARLLDRCGPPPVAEACEAVRQAAVGLQYAHARLGLVHRDVKPSNLMLTPAGVVKILDLGLARSGREPQEERGPGGALTGADERLGTVDYMAPEQWLETHTADTRADVYSLGCTLYHLLAGRPPYAGPTYDTRGKKMMGHSCEPPPPIQQFRPDVPRALAAALGRMVAKRPADRFADPAEVAEALGPFCTGHDLPALLKRAAPDAGPPHDPDAARRQAPLPPRPRAARRRAVTKRLLPAGAIAAAGLALVLACWRGAGPPGPGRGPAGETAPRDSDTVRPDVSVPAPPAAAAEGPEVVRLRVRLYRPFKELEGGGERLEPVGEVGVTSPVLRGDRVFIEARFSAAVYPYLAAINPDGSCQLLCPEKGSAPPRRGTRLGHPESETGYVTLDDAGLVCFLVVAAREPLPPFDGWRPAVDGGAWGRAEPAGPWVCDGRRCEPLPRRRVGRAEHGPRPLAEVCRRIKDRPGVAAVRAVAFPVKPDP